jgi:glycosyltransferase
MLSIITITYNNFEELISTLYSIPESEKIESIIVNGGDCKKTKEFLLNYKGKSISEKDNGIADAFNKGVKLSTGKYIMFLNSGDILINPSYLDEAVNILNSNKNISFTHSNIILFNEDGTEYFVKPTQTNIGRGMPYTHPTMIVRRELFNTVGMFDTSIRIAMDYDWVVRLEKLNYRGFYINCDPVVKMNSKGKSVIMEAEAIKECLIILKKNNYLNFINLTGYIRRVILFCMRKLLISLGLKNVLKFFKKNKYRFST